MSKRFFNTALSISMLADGRFSVTTLTSEEAAAYVREGVKNVANPTHANTLQIVSQKMGVDVRTGAEGGRISLESGDEVLVVEAGNVPRETREFTDEEVRAATFKFRKVVIEG